MTNSSMAIIPQQFGIEDTLIVGDIVFAKQIPFNISEIDKMSELLKLTSEEKELITFVHSEIKGTDIASLVNHPNYLVRIAIAMQGIALEELIKDSFWMVRYYVAQQKYKLDVLENDEHKLVKWTAVHLIKLQSQE